MRFSPRALASSRGDTRREIDLDEGWLLPYLSISPVCAIAEAGAGSGKRAAWLLGQLSPQARYLGFEPGPDLARQASTALESFGSRAEVRCHDPRFPLRLADSSQDFFLSLDLLDALRMDELYMLVSEARRTLRPGGLCFLRALSRSDGLSGRLAGALWNRLSRGRRALDLRHYISPEDWDLLGERRSGGPWLERQTLVLARL